ncbi:MAG: hypothetical protein Q9194_006466, partial [Teloschistes cf. exilis]
MPHPCPKCGYFIPNAIECQLHHPSPSQIPLSKLYGKPKLPILGPLDRDHIDLLIYFHLIHRASFAALHTLLFLLTRQLADPSHLRAEFEKLHLCSDHEEHSSEALLSWMRMREEFEGGDLRRGKWAVEARRLDRWIEELFVVKDVWDLRMFGLIDVDDG